MDRIDLNTAPVELLTQLPGISKNIAYKIVRHRERHGWFTTWRELLEVPDFPNDRLQEIRARAFLSCPEDRPGQTQTECVPPHHLKAEKIEHVREGPKAYTKELRAGRRPSKLHTEPKRSTG